MNRNPHDSHSLPTLSYHSKCHRIFLNTYDKVYAPRPGRAGF